MITLISALVGLIVLLGFVAGLIIAKLTPEEFDYSKKYLKIIYIAALIFLLGILILSRNTWIMLIGVLFFPLGIVLFEKKSNPAIIYAFLAAVLATKYYYEVTAVLAFSIGIPLGVLMMNLSKKRLAQKITMTIISFIVILTGFLMV